MGELYLIDFGTVLSHARARELARTLTGRTEPGTAGYGPVPAENAMDDGVEDDGDGDGYRKPPPWPLWVALGLWGLSSRERARAVDWGSLAVAIGCTVYGFISWPFFSGSVFVVTAFWLYSAIRWVDQHGEWP